MDFLTFRRMITPIFIQAIYWVVTALVILGGLGLLFAGDGAEMKLLGLALIIIGPIGVRIYAEILLVVFRINDTLTDIYNELRNRP